MSQICGRGHDIVHAGIRRAPGEIAISFHVPTSGRKRAELEVLFGVASFPSPVQPWLLNAVEQVGFNGGRAWVLAENRPMETWPEKALRAGLDQRTLYVRPGTASGILHTVLRDSDETAETGRLKRAGLRRYLFESLRLLISPRTLLASLPLAPALGLPRIDLIHVHSLMLACHFLPIAAVLRTPLVLTFHGMRPKGVPDLTEKKRRRLFAAEPSVIVNTEFAKSQVVALGCDPAVVRVIPQGIDLSAFPFRPTRYDPGRALRLLSVSRLDRDKGHEYTVAAVEMLESAGHRIDYRIVGTGPDRSRLEQRVQESTSSNSIRFLGELTGEALTREFQEADVFVMPSLAGSLTGWQETQGVAIQEAQASGCLVVATRTGGIPECVEEGRSAWLVPDRDADALASAIERLIDEHEQWPQWQARGRTWVEERFDSVKVGRRIWELYRQVVRAGYGR